MIAQISCLVLNGKGLVTTSTSPALTCSCIRSQNDQAQACWICTYTTSKLFIHPLIRLIKPCAINGCFFQLDLVHAVLVTLLFDC